MRIRKNQCITAQNGLDSGIERLRHVGNDNDWSQLDRKEWRVESAVFVTVPAKQSVICPHPHMKRIVRKSNEARVDPCSLRVREFVLAAFPKVDEQLDRTGVTRSNLK